MNPTALADFNDALSEAQKKYGEHFDILSMPSIEGVRESNTSLVASLLPKIRQWVDPKIWVVPRSEVVQAFHGRTFLAPTEARTVLARFAQQARAVVRSKAEGDRDVVQLVGCGMPTRADQYVALKRSEKDEKSRDYGDFTLWKACHIKANEALSEAMAAGQVARRVEEDLYIAVPLKPEFVGLAWNPDEERRENHLGMMFEVPITEAVAESMQNKEFKHRGRFWPLSGRLLAVDELTGLNLEPWSQSFLSAKKGTTR